ncbi:MAG: phosphatidate cytidylyltransferase [Elusimicrobiota bacterium]|jgi:phosphatidate cytidylyltransferase|nr:phosphatidate cytidylyltransferase [Elusimicrobiota bacterium]
MLVKRILTALIGIPLIFMCVYFGAFPFFAMMFLVVFFCVQEYCLILKKYEPRSIISLIMAVVFFILLYFYDISVLNNAAIIAISMLFILFGAEIIGAKMKNCISRIAVSFIGAFFIPLSLSYMLFIRNLPAGMEYIFLIFLTVWILDTAAYAFGKMLGKHKLSVVSPKKTIEGAIAGIVFGIISSIVIGVYIFEIFSVASAALFGFMLAVIGQFSDIAESLIKRDADIKDSGNIIPGHGGFLDRFDSYLFAAPVFYYLVKIIVNMSIYTK